MTINSIDESQRKAARVVGFTFLFAIAIVVVANYGIIFRLVVPVRHAFGYLRNGIGPLR